MSIKVLLPLLSPTMKVGSITKWFKKEGDVVSAGDVLVEIETDKAAMEVESVGDGVLRKILFSEGSENLPVNTLIAVIKEEDDSEKDIEDILRKLDSGTSTSDKQTSGNEPLVEQKINDSSSIRQDNGLTSGTGIRIFVTPLASRIAKEKQLDLSKIKGTGPNGRIVKKDVEASFSKKVPLNLSPGARSSSGKSVALGVPLGDSSTSSSSTKKSLIREETLYKVEPISNMRRIIAERLSESKSTVPHFYLSIECRIDELLKIRAQLNSKLSVSHKIKISVNDFITFVCAKSLKEFPQINSSWNGDSLIYYNNIDISIAVAINNGLITPIVKNADKKNIVEISQEIKELASRAKSGQLKPEEFQGGGFSISNLGMFGIDQFYAIINPPQSCILSVSQSVKRPIVVGEEIKSANIINLGLSCDHRVVDGVLGSKFLSLVKQYMESPVLLLSV